MRATEISGVAARKSMAAPMQNRSHGHNLASSTISSRVILNFPLLYFTEVLLLGAIKGLKQKALTVGAVQGLCFLSSERLYSSLLTQVHVCISHNCRSILRRLTQRHASRMAVADRGNAGAVQIGAMPVAFKVRDHQRRDCCGSSAQGKRQFVLKRHLMHLVRGAYDADVSRDAQALPRQNG